MRWYFERVLSRGAVRVFIGIFWLYLGDRLGGAGVVGRLGRE